MLNIIIPAAGDHGFGLGGMRHLLTACPDARREMSPHRGGEWDHACLR